jgi:hypothetical protein
MQAQAIVLYAAIAAVVVADVWATIAVARQPYLSRWQRYAQIIFVWVLPVVGAMVVLEVYRRDKPHHIMPGGGDVTGELYPGGIGPEGTGRPHQHHPDVGLHPDFSSHSGVDSHGSP